MSQIYSATAKLMLVFDQGGEIKIVWKAGCQSGKFTCDDLCGENETLLSESNLMIVGP